MDSQTMLDVTLLYAKYCLLARGLKKGSTCKKDKKKTRINICYYTTFLARVYNTPPLSFTFLLSDFCFNTNKLVVLCMETVKIHLVVNQ